MYIYHYAMMGSYSLNNFILRLFIFNDNKYIIKMDLCDDTKSVLDYKD